MGVELDGGHGRPRPETATRSAAVASADRLLPHGSSSALPARAGRIGLALIPAVASPVLAVAAIAWLPSETALALAVGGLAALLLPRHYLLGAALLAYALLPIQAIPDRPVVEHPAFALFYLWALRAVFAKKDEVADGSDPSGPFQRRAALAFVAFFTWTVAITLADGRVQGLNWVFEYAVLLLPLLAPTAARADAKRLLPMFLVLSSVVACYALVEFSIARNPLFDGAFAKHGLSYVGRWAMYRSHATLGHPLYASTFFAVALLAAFGRWLEQGQSRYGLVAVLNAAALITTLSRGGAIAAGVGALVALLASRRAASQSRRLTALLAGAAVALGGLQAVVGARDQTSEAAASAGVRTGVLDVAWRTSAAGHHLGWGAASSQDAIAAFNPSRWVLENSYLQLLVSVGIPGLLLFIAGGWLVLRVGFANRNAVGAGAWAAFLVSVLGYNALEAEPTTAVLAGFLVAMSLRTPEHAVRRGAAPRSRVSHTRRGTPVG